MSGDALVRSVIRFDGKNFQAWKFQISAVLMANEIFYVVDGTRTRPADAEGDNAAPTKLLIKDNAKATAIIASAMEDDQVVSVLVCGTAKEMWDKLITVHEQRSASNVGALTQRFYSYKMDPIDTAIQCGTKYGTSVDRSRRKNFRRGNHCKNSIEFNAEVQRV